MWVLIIWMFGGYENPTIYHSEFKQNPPVELRLPK
jgi:hypothetical protein